MALVMAKFQGGPLTGVKLPVDHDASEYRHLVHEPGSYSGDRRDPADTIHVYRRTDWATFKWDHRESSHR